MTIRKKIKILLVQSRSRSEMIEREREDYRLALGASAKLASIWSLDEKLAKKGPHQVLEGYDGVIFGGSSDYDFDGGRMKDDPFRLVAMIILSRTTNLITYALSEKVPLLGICFGHQMIASMHGGEVACDPKQKKSGTYEVTLTDEGKNDPLFRELPTSFPAQYGHKDSVTKLPKGATLLAKGARCRFSVLRYGQHVYTMQFHPELSAKRAVTSLNANAGYLPEAVKDAEKIVHESPEASKIIPLWVEKIVSK